MEIHLVKGQKKVPEGGKGVTLKERRMGANGSETKKEERNIERGEESIRGGFDRRGRREAGKNKKHTERLHISEMEKNRFQVKVNMVYQRISRKW